jgi:DNA-binding transcriptional MerR regulator
MSTIFSIGQLSTLTGCKVPTIRYYEEIGILPKAWRTEGNQRRYNESHRQRLDFIRHARALGFSQDEVKQLIELQFSSGLPSKEAHPIAQHHLEAVQVKIKQLQALADELTRMVDCCKIGTKHNCKVLEVLSNHSLCQGEH